MAMGYGSACPKPEPRARTKGRTKRQAAKIIAAVRAYVFGRDRHVCRLCGFRPAESMHEIIPRSLGGKVCPENSIATCGDGVRGCHGFAQRHEIFVRGSAEQVLLIRASSAAARSWMRNTDVR